MSRARIRRWDLVVGALASLIALAGLVVSIALRNTTSVGGSIDLASQKTLAALAGMFLTLVLVKAGIRYCGSDRAICLQSLDNWFRSRRGRD
ncbi:MAG: hypothetical protein K1X67_20700 [Fimbriimonadaceae bacterium]|jgi:hypothetical protein|nr:hypothetical protein [Fimbriimonadaceae bacterium]